MVNYRVQVTNVLIGAVNVTGVMYAADKPVGSGPGGSFVSPRTVANTILPVGVITHHAWGEIEVAIDEDEKPALYDPSPSPLVPGTLVTLVVTEKNTAGQTRTVTYGTAYVQSAQGVKLENEAEHQPYVITFINVGTRVVSAWS